jgi:hypothetical protein
MWKYGDAGFGLDWYSQFRAIQCGTSYVNLTWSYIFQHQIERRNVVCIQLSPRHCLRTEECALRGQDMSIPLIQHSSSWCRDRFICGYLGFPNTPYPVVHLQPTLLTLNNCRNWHCQCCHCRCHPNIRAVFHIPFCSISGRVYILWISCSHCLLVHRGLYLLYRQVLFYAIPLCTILH